VAGIVRKLSETSSLNPFSTAADLKPLTHGKPLDQLAAKFSAAPGGRAATDTALLNESAGNLSFVKTIGTYPNQPPHSWVCPNIGYQFQWVSIILPFTIYLL
jgi:hypothetical protein